MNCNKLNTFLIVLFFISACVALPGSRLSSLVRKGRRFTDETALDVEPSAYEPSLSLEPAVDGAAPVMQLLLESPDQIDCDYLTELLKTQQFAELQLPEEYSDINDRMREKLKSDRAKAGKSSKFYQLLDEDIQLVKTAYGSSYSSFEEAFKGHASYIEQLSNAVGNCLEKKGSFSSTSAPVVFTKKLEDFSLHLDNSQYTILVPDTKPGLSFYPASKLEQLDIELSYGVLSSSDESQIQRNLAQTQVVPTPHKGRVFVFGGFDCEGYKPLLHGVSGVNLKDDDFRISYVQFLR